MKALLLVDEKDLFRKESLGNFQNIDEIVVIDDIKEAKALLDNSINGLPPFSVLVISTVFISKDVKEKELADISCCYPGSIIVRTDSDELGLDLVKRGLATDYYTSGGDEIAKLQTVVNNAMVHKRCLDRLVEMHHKINQLEVMATSVAKK